jgi:RNA recognition motif-containing protein
LEPGTEKCKGYGFVNFQDRESAARAIILFNGQRWANRKMTVQESTSTLRNSRGQDNEAYQHGGDIISQLSLWDGQEVVVLDATNPFRSSGAQ